MSRARTSERIPPESEQLEFAQNTKTGTVHILCYGPERYWIPVTREDGAAQEVLSLISTPCRMLCGVKTFVGSGMPEQHLAVWMTGDHFEDDDLCIACVQALGGQSWRAFHADNRGPDCDDH